MAFLAEKLWDAIATVEAGHATVRRFLSAASHHTDRQMIAESSANWALHTARKQNTYASHGGASADASSPQRAVASVPRKRTTKARAAFMGRRGGAARAWLRLKTFGSSGRPPLRRLWAEYRVEKEALSPMYEKAKRVAAAAERIQRNIKRGALLFGPRQRTLKRSAKQGREAALWHLCAGRNDLGSLALVAKHATLQGLTLRDTLSSARGMAAKSARQERDANRELFRYLDEWRAKEGPASVAMAKSLLPEIGKFTLTPTPTELGFGVRLRGDDLDTIASASAWAFAHTKSSELGPRLRAESNEAHDLLLDADCPPCTPIDSKPSKCMMAGMCLCSAEGKAYDREVAAFVAALKRGCPPKSARRTALVEGRVVVQLVDAEAGVHVGPALGGDAHGRSLWLHIGLQYLNPFVPTMMKVVVVPNPGETAESADRVYVQATIGCAVLHKALPWLRGRRTVDMRLYELEETARAIPRFIVDVVPLVPLQGCREALRVLPRPRARRARGVGGAGGGPNVPRGGPADGGGESDSSVVELGHAEEDPDPLADLLAVAAEAFEQPIVEMAPPAEPPLPPPEMAPPPSPAEFEVPPSPVAGANNNLGRVGRRGQPLCTVVFPLGRISYYRNGNFQATCKRPGHLDCNQTRRGRRDAIADAASSSTAPPRAQTGGRPLGYLAAWISDCHAGETKAEHTSGWTIMAITPEKCRRAREVLGGLPGGQDLMAYERPLRPGEMDDQDI